MKSRTTRRFRAAYAALPSDARRAARKAYALWREDHSHPGLMFKRVGDDEPLYSVRIGLNYRAIGTLVGDTMTWRWIGPHDEYMRLLK